MVCTICKEPLSRKDRVESFGLEQIDKKTGDQMYGVHPKSLYEAHKLTGISLCSLINSADKGNPIIVRRRDEEPFRVYWRSIHESCYQYKKEVERLKQRKEIDEEIAKEREEE